MAGGVDGFGIVWGVAGVVGGGVATIVAVASVPATGGADAVPAYFAAAAGVAAVVAGACKIKESL